MRGVSVRDDMIGEPTERGLLLSAFVIVEIGEGSERDLALVAKTPDKKQPLADASTPQSHFRQFGSCPTISVEAER
jgi:hypothetical protein